MPSNRLSSVQRVILHGFGGAGYLLVLTEWLVVFAFVLPRFIDRFLPVGTAPDRDSVVLRPPTPEPSQAAAVLATIASLCLIGFVVYIVLAKYIPGAAKATSKAVHSTAERAAPVIMHKPAKKISAKQQRYMSERITLWLKVVLAILPAVFFATVYVQRPSLMRELAFMMSCSVSALALLLFLGQLMLARRWRAHGKEVL